MTAPNNGRGNLPGPPGGEMRRLGIGGSEVAAVLGLDPRRRPFDVWLDKKGKASAVTRERDEAASMGHLLEPLIAQLWIEARGGTVEAVKVNEPLAHKENRIAFATPDFAVIESIPDNGPVLLAPGGEAAPIARPAVALLETKARWYDQAKRFGSSGSQVVPVEILLQVMWQHYVCGGLPVFLAVLCNGLEFREYAPAFDAALLAEVVQRVEHWWQEFIVGDKEPFIEGPAAAAYLAKRFTRETEVVRVATTEEHHLLEKLADLRRQRDGVEGVIDQLETELKVAIGHDAGLESPAGRAVWFPVKGSQLTAWKDVAQHYADTPGFAALVAQHTKASEASRRFRFTPSKGEGV